MAGLPCRPPKGNGNSMPGLSGRVGGNVTGDAAAVTRQLQHFPFYGSGEVGGPGAWLAWTGIGDAQWRLRHDEAADVLVGYHGDGAGQVAPAGAEDRLELVRRLAGSSPLGLAEALDGSFAAAHFDGSSGGLTLVTDPFGHRRLYYLQRGDVLYRARHNEEALEAYDLALAMGGLSSTKRRRGSAVWSSGSAFF